MHKPSRQDHAIDRRYNYVENGSSVYTTGENMYRFWYYLRLLLTIVVVIGVAAAIFYTISLRTAQNNQARYDLQVTAAVATAIQAALYDVTRTAEAPTQVFQIVQTGQGEDLETLAERYGTTLDILHIVNRLSADVTTGDGSKLVVPVGMQTLDPARTITVYTAQIGDSLNSIAVKNSVSLALLKRDNPALAQRGVLPGDIVFIGFVL